MSASTWGTMIAAVRPWSARATTSNSVLGAAAHIADARTKPLTPRRNIRLRPKMSPSRPPVISRTAKLRV